MRGDDACNGASRATGLPLLAIVISSPALTRSISCDRCVLASLMLTIFVIVWPYGHGESLGQPSLNQVSIEDIMHHGSAPGSLPV